MRSPEIVMVALLTAACGTTGPKSSHAFQQSEKASERPTSNARATCKRGSLDAELSFIVCEDGILRKASVLNALSAPHDPDLKIEAVASRYGVQSQVFTGIETASAASTTIATGKSSLRTGKFRSREGLVQIEDKIYEVYQVSSGETTGAIFVERENAL